MKINNNKTISFLFIFIVIGLATTLLYYSYLSYDRYNERKQSTGSILLIDKIDTVLNKVDNERVYSAIYMGTKHKEDLKNLKFYRAIVDKELETLNAFLKKNRELYFYKSAIGDISKNLSYTRTRVDVLSLDYQNTLFENYFNKVVKPLMGLVERLIQNPLVENSEQFVDYFQLLQQKENLSTEKSFISFILSSSLEMKREDLLLWETLLHIDITESIALQNLRGEIFIDSIDSKYSVLSKEWIETSEERITELRDRQSILLSQSQKYIYAQLSTVKQQTIKYMVASVALLIILFILIYLSYSNIKNSRMLTDTLSDLEADLNEEQRTEIKKVLKKNDTIAIYKFLVNAIKEPSRAKDHFLANMSHEIRTPLNGIIGFTNILKETELKEDQKEFVHIIEESSNSLIHIVNDILDFSKVTAGKIEFENIPFSVMEKFEATVDSYAAKAAQKNIDLGLFIDPTLPMELMGDGTKISQVIINLLSNAVKFTNKNGKINIAIEKLSQTDGVVRLKFSVKDSGIGMTKKQQSKIFDAFSQADASTSRKFGGTGLGLTISSKFVSLMGGKLEVESAVGEGTTFFFSLDLKETKEKKERAIPKLTDVKTAYITIPDIESNHENIQAYIEYIGADFKTYNYLEVLNMETSTLPDILFIDHQYINDEKIIGSLVVLNTKTVLISTAEIEKCRCSLKDEISKLIYKPLNFSKTIRALNIVKTKTSTIEQQLTEVEDIASHKVFKDISALVVEDNHINQKLIQNILVNFDISVALASNGAEALKLRKENDYDIIFMDIQMPIMDGVEATEEIIEYEKLNQIEHIPIVALTANTLEADKERYLSAGMDKYLKKPIDVADLTAIIEEYFPIEEIRESMPLNNQLYVVGSEKSKIILYKETELMAKIYTAVLNNLGYSVDRYSSADKFLEQLDRKEYKFALFDAKPFREVNSDSMVVELIRDSGATPIAFVERDNTSNYCETLKPIGHANEISNKLIKCG
ncbi:response regulator [Sulfurovum sp. bin170]|uniref:ATP-binding protein n=1 Tax=Sulfurovum sp. bin170 TaxID=2695268 RepID=UPI0013DF13FD|nr:ATP-binding protein [Sulfurovum sp. bin170]NEW59971.1 response regulator [Sulfurovum sp. bin170]